MAMSDDQLKWIFSYHTPKDDQPEKYQAVNEAFLKLAMEMDKLMPPGAGATSAIRKIADARMAVNAAIALEGRF